MSVPSAAGAKSDVQATAELLAHAFPGSSVASTAYLEWLYERSPFGRVLESNLDDERGRAGHCAFLPIVLSRDGAEQPCALSVNTAVHRRARGHGVFARLAQETATRAQAEGMAAVVGVSNANSTPIFTGPLQFELLTPLPAKVMVPAPGPRSGLQSDWCDGEAFAANGLARDLGELLQVSALGAARRWTPTTLRWRLEKPGTRYALHRGKDLLAVSCADSRHGLRVAILSKVFASTVLGAASTRALVRAVCRFHRTPVLLHVGLNDRVCFHGFELPSRLRESPLNLIYRPLGPHTGSPRFTAFEFLDFDVY